MCRIIRRKLAEKWKGSAWYVSAASGNQSNRCEFRINNNNNNNNKREAHPVCE